MADKRYMKASDIPVFVDRVIKSGCDICAIGHFNYCLGQPAEPATGKAATPSNPAGSVPWPARR